MSNVDKIISEYLKSGFDFGFSASDVNHEEVVEKTKSEIKERLEAIEKLVMPFYVNMMNAKGSTITWPEEKRKKEIKEQIEKLLKLTRL